MIDVLGIDDHTIFRSGLQRLLLDESDMRVVAEASNGADALEQIGRRHFDVVLLDINMEGATGSRCWRRSAAGRRRCRC